MGWVKDALQKLQAGRAVQVRPFGGSMRGRIESGQLVTLAPADPLEIAVEDVVLVRWQGNYLLHLVKEIKDGQFLIGNNLGKINGWVSAEAICGKVTAVDAATDTLPADEILVRGSEEPPVEHSEVLLRAAQPGQETEKKELLRVNQE